MAPAAASANWAADTWQTDDGLPNNDVTGLTQSDDGHLWIANSGGLARFDGVTFEGYPDGEMALPGQKVSTLLRARSGALWLGMDHGALIRLDRQGVATFTRNLPRLITWSLLDDPEGGIWGVYGGNTICRWRQTEVHIFTDQHGLPARPRGGCSLACDLDGAIWLATAGELDRFDGQAFVTVAHVSDPDVPLRIAAARDGGLWICAGLTLKHLGRGQSQPTELASIGATEPMTEPTVVMETRDGGVWVGTSSSGLFRVTAESVEAIPTSHARISSVLEDREGHLWVGTRGGGIDRIRPRAIDVESFDPAHRQAIQSVCEALDGSMWATTEDGTLLRCRDRTWSLVSASPDWPGGRATCVAADAAGAVWIGTRNARIYRVQDGRYTVFDHDRGIAAQVCHALLADADGDVWIGGEVPDRLMRIHAGVTKAYAVPAGIRIMRAMARDVHGDLWVGTSKGVLLRVHDEKVEDLTAKTTGAPLSIRCLYATSDGTLWIGYVGGGVGRYRDGQFARIDHTQGLYDDVISQIVDDGQGWMWFGADHGLFKVRREELEAVALHRVKSVRPIHYGRDTGLPSLQANAGDSPGAIRSHDGKLWIALRTGVAVVDPGRLQETEPAPVVLLKRVTVDEKICAAYGGLLPIGHVIDTAAAYAEPLRLEPSHRRLQFDFAAMTLAPVENIHFRYRLIGIDDHWLDAGATRHANYSRLPAADYRFEVAASNSNGELSRSPATLAFTVEPFFWQTWWFRIGMVALFTTSVVGAGRYISFRRLRNKLQELRENTARHQERARIARDIHDDLGGTLTQAILQLERARKHRLDPKKTEANLQQLSLTTKEVVRSLDEIVWAANAGNDVLPAFIDYIGQFALDYLRAANIRCRLDFPAHPPAQPLPPEARHNLYLVVKETLTNVVRHARAEEVRLQIAASDDLLVVRMADNGCGFDSSAAAGAGSDGLRNLRQRMISIGGSLEISSSFGAGTTIVATWSFPSP